MQNTRMAQWGDRHVMLSGWSRENSTNKPQISSSVIENEEDEGTVMAEVVSEEGGKIEFPLEEARPKRQRKLKQSSIVKPKRKKHDNSVERWSMERYKQAEQHLLDILREEGAVFGKPISRPHLRMAGRKHIGDTGLLDHLLKHIDGKVAPGGSERFRRWHNTDGVMEYWLESAELDDIRREAGVQDPYWVPPSWWKPGGSGALEKPASSSDIKFIKEDLFNLKRELAELVSKKKEQEEANSVEGMLKEFITWQARTDQRLMEISSSVRGMQDMYRDLITWKAKTEQQLMELSNLLGSMQAAKAYSNPPGPTNSEPWEEWLESSNLEGMQGNDITTMLVNTDPMNTEWDVDPYSSLPTRSKPSDAIPTHDAACASELAMLKEQVDMVKRDMKELLLKKQDSSLPVWNKDASLNVNCQVDLKNPSVVFQQVLKEMVDWRAKMEQQMKEVSNAIRSMQAAKQLTAFSPSSTFYL